MLFSASLSLMALAFSVSAQNCPIQFEGRVSQNTSLAVFDTSASLFNPSFVIGKGLKFSQTLRFPAVPASLFDSSGSKAVEVTINDASIFTPSPTNAQIGFRRTELLPASNNGSDPSTTGIKTLHFSLMKDTKRLLNISHEYQLVFLESANFSTNQFVLKTGSIIGGNVVNPDTLTLVGNVNVSPIRTLFQTPFAAGVWHNFALVLDFTKKTTQVLYSVDKIPLMPVTAALSNDISGQGQFHFGALKKPIGDGLTDVTKQGFQEAGINEGVIYGGIFMEDSANGCISTCG